MLNVTKVIAVNAVAISKPNPEIMGHFFDVIPKIIPKTAPIKPKAKNTLPAELDADESAAAVIPAAHAPDNCCR